MPSGAEHRRITEEFLGWDIPAVHQIMDAAAAYLGGRHRVVGHNLRAVQGIELLFGREGRKVAVLHMLEDAGVIRSERQVAAIATLRSTYEMVLAGVDRRELELREILLCLERLGSVDLVEEQQSLF